MTSTDSVGPAKAERYREIANSVRALIPSMRNPEVRDQLDVLAFCARHDDESPGFLLVFPR